MKEPAAHRSVHTARRAFARGLPARIVWPALLVSAALHVVAFLLIGFRTDGTREPAARPPRLLRIVPVMQAYQIAVVDVEVPSIEAQLPAPRTPAVEVPQLVPNAPAAGVATPPPRAEALDPSLERLRYRTPRTDVWRRSDPPPRSAEETVRERVAAQLSAYNDSIAAEAAASARATDWTVKDGEGGRWGVSPGQIHLGSVTLPLPFAFSTPAGRREEVAGRLANWTAIQQQATIVEGREIVKDRVKAIEQRKAAERAARQNPATTTTGGGSGGTQSGSGPPRTGGS